MIKTAREMHIAFVIYSLSGGGAERVTSHMAAFWASRGCKVSVVTFTRDVSSSYELPDYVELVCLDLDRSSSNPFAAVVNNARRLLSIRDCIRVLNPSVIISMMPDTNVLVALACTGLKAKKIGCERHYPGLDYTGRLWSLLRRFTYRMLDAVVVQTQMGRRWIEENTNAKLIVVIPNPLVLPLLKTKPVVPTRESLGRHVLLGVGRLTDQKQFDHLIKSFSLVSGSNTDWDLVIVGEGDSKNSLTKLAAEYDLKDRVVLIGRVGNISEWYDSADIFSMTSKSEGFPNALIEAMGSGLAVVSYDCLTGPSEIIDTGYNGILVEGDNIEGMARSLEQLMQSRSLRDFLGKNARDIVDRLSPNAVMKMWEETIERL